MNKALLRLAVVALSVSLTGCEEVEPFATAKDLVDLVNTNEIQTVEGAE